MHGLFGLAGFTLGAALALRLAAGAAWQEPLISQRRGPGLAMLAVIVMALGARRVRAVLFLPYFDSLDGSRAEELAEAIARDEQTVDEAEREHDRKTITGVPYVILMVGLMGGMFLAARWLPEPDGITVFQGSVSGLIGTGASLYLWKTKPRGCLGRWLATVRWDT